MWRGRGKEGRKEGRNSVRKEKKHEGTKPNSKAGN